jgi:hypothetical protein
VKGTPGKKGGEADLINGGKGISRLAWSCFAKRYTHKLSRDKLGTMYLAAEYAAILHSGVFVCQSAHISSNPVVLGLRA